MTAIGSESALVPISARARALATDLEEHMSVIASLREPGLLASMAVAIDLICSVYSAGGKAIFFGNGGSAADASHLAAELAGRFLRERRALPAVALADNHAAVTAIANDYGYNQVFARQLEASAAAGDIAIGFSTSGRSANVATGLATAARLRLRTVAFTGGRPGPVGEAAEVTIAIPSQAVPRIQEAHMLLGHVLCDHVEQLFVS